jgi:hypothetical protein
MRALAAIVLAACSSAAPSPALHGNAPAHRPSGPAPQIRWATNAFDHSQLPAIAHAGDRVVLGIVDYDERGWKNLRLEIRDRADHTLATHVVMKPGETDLILTDGLNETASPELEARITAANRMLADVHAARDLVSMRAFDHQHLPVTFDGDQRVRVRIDGRVVANVDGRSWIGCGMPPLLENVYKADDINAVVVEIGFIGDDSCVPPSEHVHVIAW